MGRKFSCCFFLFCFFSFIPIQCTKYIRMFHLAKKANIKDTGHPRHVRVLGMEGGLSNGDKVTCSRSQQQGPGGNYTPNPRIGSPRP